MAGLQDALNEIRNSEFYRNILGLFSGIFLARLIPAVFALLLARLYAPEQFGAFVLYLSIASLLSVFINGGYEGALILGQVAGEKKTIFSLALRNNVLMSLAISAGIIIYLCTFHEGGKSDAVMLVLVPFYASGFGILQLVRNLLISNKSFKKLSALEVVRAMSTGILQAGFFFFMPDTGLFTGTILAQIVTLGWIVHHQPGLIKMKATLFSAEEINVARRYKNFPLYSVPSEFFNYLSNQLPVFMVKPFFGAAMLGYYSFSHRYISIPVQLTSISIGSVYIQKARSLLPDNPGELASLTWSLLKKQVWIAIVPFTLLALWGNDIFGFLFGREWEFSGSLAQLLSPWLFMVFISSPLSTILIVKEKQKVSMIFNMFLLAARALVLTAGGFILRDVRATIGLFSLTGLLFFTFLALYSLHLAGINLFKAGLLLFKALVAVSIPLILIKLWL